MQVGITSMSVSVHSRTLSTDASVSVATARPREEHCSQRVASE
jgi:hypothetical protein